MTSSDARDLSGEADLAARCLNPCALRRVSAVDTQSFGMRGIEMKTRRTWTLLAASLVAIALAVAGCGNSPSSTNSGGSGSASNSAGSEEGSGGGGGYGY